MTTSRDDDPPLKPGPGLNDVQIEALPPRKQPSFPLEHPYFEIVYTPLIGPTAMLLARALSRHLHLAGGSTKVSAAELSVEVGVRASDYGTPGRKSRLVRAVDRLAHEQLVVRMSSRRLGVRTAVPFLEGRALDRLPFVARNAHDAYVAELL